MIQILIILIPIIIMTMLVPQLQKRLDARRFRLLMILATAIYLLGNLYFTLLSRVPETGVHLELMPFRTYGILFEKPDDTGEEMTQITGLAASFLKDTLPIHGLILNVLLYYPLGYLLVILFPKLRMWQVIAIGAACSLVTEILQYAFSMGWCEMDDLIHNTLGAAIGMRMRLRQCRRAGTK